MNLTILHLKVVIDMSQTRPLEERLLHQEVAIVKLTKLKQVLERSGLRVGISNMVGNIHQAGVTALTRAGGSDVTLVSATWYNEIWSPQWRK